MNKSSSSIHPLGKQDLIALLPAVDRSSNILFDSCLNGAALNEGIVGPITDLSTEINKQDLKEMIPSAVAASEKWGESILLAKILFVFKYGVLWGKYR